MERSEKLSLEQVRAFLEGSEEVSFQAQNRQEVYSWVNWILRQQKLWRTQTLRERAGAALPGQNDRVESGPGDPSDWNPITLYWQPGDHANHYGACGTDRVAPFRKRPGVLLAGYGSPATSFQFVFLELENERTADGVKIANRPSAMQQVNGDSVSIQNLLNIVQSQGSDSLLYLTIRAWIIADQPLCSATMF